MPASELVCSSANCNLKRRVLSRADCCHTKILLGHLTSPSSLYHHKALTARRINSQKCLELQVVLASALPLKLLLHAQ